MMRFEGDHAWFHLMNAELDLFKVVMPYVVVRDLWTSLLQKEPCTDEAMRAWLSSNSVLILVPIHYRVQAVRTSRDHDDYRIPVIPIDKDSVLYKGALADRWAYLASRDEGARTPSFAPPIRFIYGPGEGFDDHLRDTRPKTAPPQRVH
jgi:hypothetical protein